MSRLHSLRLTREMTVRIIADALLINAAALAALSARFLYMVAFERASVGTDYNQVFWNSISAYCGSTTLLTSICLVIFYVSGFYTYGRTYYGPYKALFVAQAVSLGYLIFGFLLYFLAGNLIVQRAELILAWVFSVILLVGARLWARLWLSVIRAERRLHERPEDRKIHRVLVIGGAGYIGSALLPKLLERGYYVRVLDLLLYGTDPISDLLTHPRIEVLQADFRCVDKVVEAMRDVDAVIHLGAIVGDPACALDEQLTIEVNLMATRMIAEVAKGCGVSRFIFASTCSVYGACDEVLNERSALNPVSLYARSKIASERVLMSMTDERFAPTIVRFGTIYGLSGRTRFDLVVNLLTAKAVVEGQITIMGGDQWRPFVHVDDAALAVYKILISPFASVRNEIFNVGSDEQNFTIQDVGEIIQRQVPTAKLIDMGSDSDRRNYRVNFGKIRKALGFVPRWTVERGIQQVIEAFQAGKITDYRDARYSNVKFLKEEGTSHLIRHEDRWAYELINDNSPDSPEVPA